MLTTWIVSGIILVLVTGLCVWVTNKAYSRKWDEE
jgi:hypothetical protein